MVWKHNGRTIQTGRAWVSDDNKKYGAGWNNLTDAEKKSAGLVWEDDPVVETFDNRFYWAKGVERKLEDENVVDVDGKAVIDPTTGKQSVALGLKSIYINQTKNTANYLLSKSDWEITRKAEKGTAIASATSTYRDKVRTACNTIETKINDCSKLSDFIALFDVPLDSDGNPTGKAAMYDFPDEE
jgi:5-deoxy-D-glucuronate isomerase